MKPYICVGHWLANLGHCFAVSCNTNGWSWRNGIRAKCKHDSRQQQLDNLLFNSGNTGGYTVTGLNGCAESVGKDFRISMLYFERSCERAFYHTWFWIAMCGRSQLCLFHWQKLWVWRWSGTLRWVQSQVLEDCLSCHVVGMMFSSVADVCCWAGSWGEFTYWHDGCGPVWCICLCDGIKLKRGILPGSMPLPAWS